MPLNIIGISAHFHDAACCLLQDGHITAAAQEERFTRLKHDPRLPISALKYCLREGGIDISQVDCIAYYEDPVKKAARQLWMTAANGVEDPKTLGRIDPNRAEREIRELTGFEGLIRYADHHRSHAASAYYCSGFADAAIFTVDGVGEWATTTYGRGLAAEITIIDEVDFPDSLGLLYSTITAYLGFDVNDAEYKVMGLAPYGKPRYLDKIRALFQSTSGGQYALDLRYFDFGNLQRMYSDELIALFGQPPRPAESTIDAFHQDVARSLQYALEDVLLEKVGYLHHRAPSENLCMAGGVALNCVANGRIRRDGPFKRLFVQPAAGDAGTAIGAAMLAHAEFCGQAPNRLLEHVYLGPAFSTADVNRALRASEFNATDYSGRETELLEDAATRLASGEVLGWFHGRMEFGPRALGARSILADPRLAGMRERVNTMVKKRESFRPFAPAVLEHRSRDLFELDHPSPFMLETCRVTPRMDLPSVTHVDGSARVQTVTERVSPRFFRLLAAFERKTNCPVLLNTSFNMRGEPIVCTPDDALLCFMKSGMDALVLEDFVITREAIPKTWPELLARLEPMAGAAITHSVYTLI
jgi:carbamoyltransferase